LGGSGHVQQGKVRSSKLEIGRAKTIISPLRNSARELTRVSPRRLWLSRVPAMGVEA
jgi:hypothetical protein